MSTSAEDATKTRGPYLGPERRRPMILDAALEIAIEAGVSAVTIGAVALRLGVTRPAVYSSFADRVELIDALLERETEQLVALLLGAMHSARGTDPEAAFTTGYRALMNVVATRSSTWRLIFSASPDPAVAVRFADARTKVAHEASRWIAPALEAWWGTTDLERKMPVLIELFMSSCEAAARSLLSNQNSWTADELGDFYGRLMCRAFHAAA